MALLVVVSTAVALFMCWLLVNAGLHKINPANKQYYAQLVSTYTFERLKPKGWVIFSLGIAEIALALLLILPHTRSYVAPLVCLLLLSYMASMAFQLYQGKKDLACGCSGPNSHLKVSMGLLLRNCILAAGVLFCLLPLSPLNIDLGFLAGCVALACIVFYLSCEQLLANAQKLTLMRG